MIRWLAVAICGAFVVAPSQGQAQDDLVVLIVDPGETQMNQARLRSAIERTTRRSMIRMTDERAPTAHGRLTIAFSRPNRWVLRYEAGGQIAWVSDRIVRPGQLRGRLAELSRGLVNIVDGETRGSSGGSPPPQPRQRADTWDEALILALQDEIVDPFESDPPLRRRPVAVLWSEVVDPFFDHPATRATVGAMWSEVLDPWAAEHRRRR